MKTNHKEYHDKLFKALDVIPDITIEFRERISSFIDMDIIVRFRKQVIIRYYVFNAQIENNVRDACKNIINTVTKWGLQSIIELTDSLRKQKN